MMDNLAHHIAERATQYCQHHRRTTPAPVMADLFDLGFCPPLADNPPRLEEAQPAPDWVVVERLLKSRDLSPFFFHWGDEELPPYHPDVYPVLRRVFEASHFPEIMGEVYVKCYEVLAEPLPEHWLPVFRLYPGLLSRVMWTLVFYLTLKEGVRLHSRERQRERRRAKRESLSLDEPHIAEVVGGDAESTERQLSAGLEERLAISDTLDDEDFAAADLGRLFAALTQRERQVAELLAEGVPQTSIAGQLGLTPARISQVVSQLRAKCKRAR